MKREESYDCRTEEEQDQRVEHYQEDHLPTRIVGDHLSIEALLLRQLV